VLNVVILMNVQFVKNTEVNYHQHVHAQLDNTIQVLENVSIVLLNVQLVLHQMDVLLVLKEEPMIHLHVHAQKVNSNLQMNATIVTIMSVKLVVLMLHHVRYVMLIEFKTHQFVIVLMDIIDSKITHVIFVTILV